MSGGVRFAPSPTGRFHVGNLRSAWIAHAWAKALGEPWVLRFEDIDAPRVVEGARDLQLRDMEALGLRADRIYWQSERRLRHWNAFARGVGEGKIYACYCSRAEVRRAIEGLASAPHGDPAVDLQSAQSDLCYSGHCRNAVPAFGRGGLRAVAWRFRVAEDSSGQRDFIVARSTATMDVAGHPDACDFVPAYDWACGVDDHDGAYRLLVRAWDLGPVTARHRLIHSLLDAWNKTRTPFPAVFHTALVTQNDGHRLEKRTPGVTIEEAAQAGLSPDELARLLATSFDGELLRKGLPGESAIFGETQRTLTLAELKFPAPSP